MNKSEKVQVINTWLSIRLLKATKHTTEEKHEGESSYDEDTEHWQCYSQNNSKTIHGIEMKFGRVVENRKLTNLV